jgi:membrane peptidoglycan carboxypeptidase
MSAELTAPHNQPPPQEPGIVEPNVIDTGEITALRLENPTALSTTLVELSPVASPASTPFPDIILTPRQRRALYYLARRRMLHARIIRRKVLANRTLTTDTPPTTAIVLGTTEHISSIDSIKDLEPGPSTTIPTEDMQPTQGTSDPRGTLSGEQVYSDIPRPNNPTTPAPIIDTPPAVPIISRSQLTPARPTKQERTSILRSLPPMPPLPPRSTHKPVPVYRPEITTIVPRPYQPTRSHTRAMRQKLLRHLSRKHLRRARAADRKARLRLWTTIWTVTSLCLAFLVSLATAGYFTAYNFYHQTQLEYEHQVDTLRSLLPLDNLKIYDSKGALLAQLTDQGVHTTVKLNQISPFLQNATVATEDKNFWTNEGIDLLRIARAALDDLRSGRVIEGGSTITQQLIKNLIVGNQATIERKLREVVLTPLVNSRYSKSDILEMYLNSIYYGHQAYGIDAAAAIYFGLQDMPGRSAAMQLDLAQSAVLAGIPSNPSAYDPLGNPGMAYDRFVTVLSLMETQHYITRVQALDAMREAQDTHFFKTGAVLRNRAPHFVNFVLSQLELLLHLTRSQLSRSGLVVDTTLDIALQDKIQKIAQRHIAELRSTHHVTNAAEVLIDFHTGAIISLLGSIDFNNASIDGQVDVTQSYRQPGSSFKPYVYVTAFAQGASPAQAIVDGPTSILLPGGDPPVFTPHNYDLGYHGHMTLRCALQNSLNVPAVKVLQHVGISAAMQTAYDMGITSYQGTPGYSLVLGGLGIRLIDHTSAMGVFANGGVRVGYYTVNKAVLASTGKVVYQHQFNQGKRVISAQLAYMMTNVLSDNASRTPEFLDCNVLQLYSNSQQDCWQGNRGVIRPAAAKTGTTSDFRDNWTVGYTTDYVMGVWAGNDDNTPMYNVTGVQGAAPIWHDAMLVAEHGHPIRNFTYPGGLVQATVTYPDGVMTTDWFLPGTVPTFILPTPTPAPIPTANPTPTVTPLISNPIPATPPQVAPYCPSSYSFAFNPPPDSTQSPAPGWW